MEKEGLSSFSLTTLSSVVKLSRSMKLVANVLRRLEVHGVVVTASKTRLAMAEIECLGYIVSEGS
jgi:hypothetical protein